MKNVNYFVVGGLGIALVLAIFLSPWASSKPDGLEWVAEEKGFIEKARDDFFFISLIPDYSFPGIKSEAVATALAGFVGTLLTFATALALAELVKKKRGKKET